MNTQWLRLSGLAIMAAAGAALAAAPQPALPANAAPPNIVLILIDDMGYGDIGPFGSKKNRTPNLDRMAAEGMRLTSFYAAPVCSVSRAQVNTGCYGVRVSIPGVFGPGGASGLNAQEHTTAELLKERGYRTICIGKWHLGDQPEFLPTRHGFDHYFGIPYSNDMNRRSAESGKSVVPLLRDEKVIELLDGEGQDTITERYTDEAVKFIRENRERPFFLYFPHTAVHVPIHPGAKFKGQSANGGYGDWVEEVDWSAGRVLDTLRELGLDRRTLVIFSSDNGPWLSKGKDGGEAGPLRGGKGSTWEGGVRVPTIAWWPGKVAAGSACDAVAGNIDFLPTFVSVAGGTVPADRVIDGRDFSPLLFGASKTSPREAHYYYRGHKLEAVRSGAWKLALSSQAAGMGSEGKGANASGLRLYNLDEDIGEQKDVAAQNPEVVKRLQGLAAKMIADLGDGTPGPGVRPAGRVENPKMLYAADAPGKKAAPAKPRKAGKAAALDTLKIGDTLGPEDAPVVLSQPITITCEVEPAEKSGVIVAHGGASVGYAVYLQGGQAVFTVRTGKENPVSITAKETPSGRFTLEASLAKDGAMTLKINGQPSASGKAPGLLGRQPQENFCVGHDDRITVGNYDGQKKFSGAIRNLKVVTGGDAQP